jgi:putative glycerol-1-phosphate prenyltransferase
MIYSRILDKKSKRKKQIAVLIDPDKAEGKQIVDLARLANTFRPDCFFIGGSLLMKNRLDAVLRLLRNNTDLPLILFPGTTMQISPQADALLFLSLISGRNPDYLIDRHVHAAPLIRNSKQEVIPTGYMLIDTGKTASVHYLSGTFPLPGDKPDIAVCTAMAGEMLGLKMIYLEAGSGAKQTVSVEMVQAVRNKIEIPLLAGGGIRSPEQAAALSEAGADMLVVGTALEEKPGLLQDLCAAIKS